MKKITNENLNRELAQMKSKFDTLSSMKTALQTKIQRMQAQLANIEKKQQKLDHRGKEIKQRLQK